MGRYITGVAGAGGGGISDLVDDTTPQLGGDLDTNGNQFNASSYRQIASASLGTGTHTFDYANGDYQKLTATGNITLATSNFVAGQYCSFMVEATDWGAHTITHPGGMQFAAGTSPSYTAAGSDLVVITKDSADVYTMFIVASNIS